MVLTTTGSILKEASVGNPWSSTDVPEKGLWVGNELLPLVRGEAVNYYPDFCTRARYYPAVGLRNHIRNGDNRINLFDAADLFLEDEDVGKETPGP